MQQLYATWRMDYISAPKPEGEGCIFCAFPAERRDEERFILHRGEACYVIMNLYPYNTNGNRGIAVGLNHIQKIADGEPLGGARGKAENEFDDWDDDLGL